MNPGRSGAAEGNKTAPASPSTPTEVRSAHLKFEVVSRVPELAARISNSEEQRDKVTTDGATAEPKIFARPMQEDGPWKGSRMEIRLLRCDADGNALENESVNLKGAPLLRRVPPALWGQYASSYLRSSFLPLPPHLCTDPRHNLPTEAARLVQLTWS